MGALVAILDKRDENVAKAAVAMLKALEAKGSEAYGIGSPTGTNTQKSLEAIEKPLLDSSVAVGYAFSKILPKDKLQPLKLKDAAMVFDGRIYQANATRPDAEIAESKLRQRTEQAAVLFIKKTEGDFAFAVAAAGKIVAGRDVMGARPLYYGENAGFAALASERKALWSIGIKKIRSFPPGCMSLVGKHGFKFTAAKRITYSEQRQITLEAAARELRTLLKDSVRQRVQGLEQVAVAFSGGLDSSIIALLAKRTRANVVLIHVSLRNKPESESAQRAAEDLKLPIHSYLYNAFDVQKSMKRVMVAIEEPNPVKVSIGIPMYWVAEKTAEMGFKVILAGQGADELFGGYRRYVDDYLRGKREAVRKAIFNDVIRMYEANLERDFKIFNGFNIELRLPFATHRMAEFAMGLPLELKIQRTDETLRKLVLRQLAKDLGLPPQITDRPKRAIQYSTGVNEAISKIVKREGEPLSTYLERMFRTTTQGTCRGPREPS